MCSFSKPKAPPAVEIPAAPVAPPPPAAQAPEQQDQAVAATRNDERLRKLRAAQENTTLVTGGQGLTAPASTGMKTLYGQ